MMNQLLKGLLVVNLLSIQLVFAETLPAEGNYWRCSAYDSESKEWVVNSGYELSAVNQALDACKKQSNLPKSCKTARETCEYFSNGTSTRPMWRCIALDQLAKEWASNVYAHRDDAAIAAREYCQQKSTFPDTCYINLMTCKNLNSRD